jgi:lactoylglutathione lyase
MKLGYCILYVPDVPAALSFYEQAFGLSRKFLHESNTYGELATGTTRLAFAAESLAQTHGDFHPSRPGEKPCAMEVALVTDDVAAAFARAVAAGAKPHCNPEQKPWGQTVGYVRDPNGFLIELCTPID